ncbi:hypothetical protein HA402_007759 [Bradysia odoriphaga]|nr:hypothetical protein HA402_007759 [Bradysia odoriphaga]
MSATQTKYELLKDDTINRQRHTYIQICLLVALCALSSIAVFVTWTAIYRKHINIPPKLNNIPDWMQQRSIAYAKHYHETSMYIPRVNNISNSSSIVAVKQLENERIYPSKYGNFIYTPSVEPSKVFKLVCYYTSPNNLAEPATLYPKNIDPQLCTHLNVGIVQIADNVLVVDETLHEMFEQTKLLKARNKELKVLIWVAGFELSDFSEMTRTHANRKQFIQSLKLNLELYRLDGVDLDWEFPSSSNRERQHFSQLLHEIRREYQREHRTYLLSVAVAAPEGIAFYAYDVAELNNYADYVNIMTYDYHFYSQVTPFTGLNSPLYKRHNENSMLSLLNINASVNYYVSQGLDKRKIVIGLPTYGHTFHLVNAFNTKIGAPSDDSGSIGEHGFVTYSELCWFKQNNFFITSVFDVETCSPYLYTGNEWISYEDERSIECKTNFIKSNGFGGAMLFSLNTDDFLSYCKTDYGDNNSSFPLARKMYSILFDEDSNDTV